MILAQSLPARTVKKTILKIKFKTRTVKKLEEIAEMKSHMEA